MAQAKPIATLSLESTLNNANIVEHLDITITPHSTNIH